MTPTKELIAALRALAANLGRHPGAATATEAANRLDALTAPVEGMTLETTEEERAWLSSFTAEMGHTDDGETFRQATLVFRLLSDFDRLSSALAAERAEKERLAGALREIEIKDQSPRLMGGVFEYALGPYASIARAALSQEKQP